MEGWNLVTVGSHSQTYKQSYRLQHQNCQRLQCSASVHGVSWHYINLHFTYLLTYTLALFKSQLASHMHSDCTTRWCDVQFKAIPTNCPDSHPGVHDMTQVY